MSKKSSPKAPAAPDPNKIIGAEAGYNRYNTNTPFGSTSWSGTPGSNDYGTTTTLSPEMQGIVQRMFQQAGQGVQDPGQRALPPPVANTPTTMDPSSQIQYSSSDPKYAALEKAVYDRQASQFEPQFAQQSRSFDQSMADRGQPSGGEAYDTGFANMSDAQNRARVDAANAATIAGRQAFESDRGYNADQFNADRQFGNILNQENIGNLNTNLASDRGFALDQGGQDYSRLAQLLGMTPNESGQPLDVTGPYDLNYQGQLAKYQTQAGQNQGMWGNLGSLANTGILAMLMRGK